MGKFIADPEILIPKGNEIKGISGEFNANIAKVYDTIDHMVQTEYISPEAMEIKKEIDNRRKDLEDMAKVINQYGDYCISSGNKVIDNQDGVIGEIH